MKKTIFYHSLSDDFAGNHIHTKKVPTDFPLINDRPLWRGAAFVFYHGIALPIVHFFYKIAYGLKMENAAPCRAIKGGFFLYGNHTQNLDAFSPCVCAFPRKAYIIAGPDAVSIPGLKNIVMMLGCLPIPSSFRGLKKLKEAIEKRIREGSCVAIFPEAHIWPYFTGVRPFAETSFLYPASLDVPVVGMALVYRKSRIPFRKKPSRTLLLSDPIYPKKNLSEKENALYLRDRVYEFLLASSKKNEVEYIHYEKI